MKKILGMCGLLILLSSANATELGGGIPGGFGNLISVKSIEASSYLKEVGKPDNHYGPNKAYDSDYNTAWVEGADGHGIGEWIKFTFAEHWKARRKDTDIKWISRISVINGFAASKAIYFANNRVKRLGLEFSDGTKLEINLKDGNGDYQSFPLKDKKIKAKWCKMTILDVYKGSKYDDTCISNVIFEEEFENEQ